MTLSGRSLSGLSHEDTMTRVENAHETFQTVSRRRSPKFERREMEMGPTVIRRGNPSAPL
jgi:hypothetical protein